MSIKVLLFDVDGTLADTEEAHRRAFNAAFAEKNLPFVWDVARYAELLRVAGGRERLTFFFESQDLAADEKVRLLASVPALHKSKNEKYAELIANGAAPLRSGIARLIDEAEAAQIRLGIASTTSPENVSALLEAGLGADAATHFAVIACAAANVAKKPAPDIYEHALSKLDLTADEAIAFEDSEIGLRAAKSAGIFTVVTPTRWTESQDFRQADLQVPELGDPARPLDEAAATLAGGNVVTLEALMRMHEASRLTRAQPRGVRA